eukprot:Tbor_TRINITY_DN4892_c2_g5::TRINITY_DN4892_c2_g5_i1::g.1395::m.1395
MRRGYSPTSIDYKIGYSQFSVATLNHHLGLPLTNEKYNLLRVSNTKEPHPYPTIPGSVVSISLIGSAVSATTMRYIISNSLRCAVDGTEVIPHAKQGGNNNNNNN